MMPQIDGYDLLNYIRPTGTPCIFITAKAAVEGACAACTAGPMITSSSPLPRPN